MIAPTGCPCVALFSRHSNPKRHYPKGPNVQTIQKAELKDLGVADVNAALQEQMQKNSA